MDVFALCQIGFDEEKEVQVHQKGLKKLISVSDLNLLCRVIARI